MQERLATLAGVLPDGIRPQMTPPASIMGQIVIAGMYRQRGPKGGELVPIGKTGLHGANWSPSRGQAAAGPGLAAGRSASSLKPGSRCPWSTSTGSRLTQSQPRHRPTPSESSLTDRRQDARGRVSHRRSSSKWRCGRRPTGSIRPRLLQDARRRRGLHPRGRPQAVSGPGRPAALLEYDVTLQEVEQALSESNINTSGGFAVKGETERPIRVLGRLGPDSQRGAGRPAEDSGQGQSTSGRCC